MTDLQIVFNPPTQLVTVHPGHHNITDYDIRLRLPQKLPCLLTVSSHINILELRLQDTKQIATQFWFIFDHQCRVFSKQEIGLYHLGIHFFGISILHFRTNDTVRFFKYRRLH